MKIYKAEKLFTGSEWLPEHAIIIEENIIKGILPNSEVQTDLKNVSSHYMIAPSFIDLQIYGAGGRLLAVYPETESIIRLRDYCKEGGANYCVPTVATNSYEVFFKAIDAIRNYWNEGGKGILGLHVEGPWINPIKRGAHIESFIHSPTEKQVKQLLDYGKDVIKIITLAPEVCSNEIIDLIDSYGIIISAGHSNATFEEATAAFDYKIPIATHLFNAMSSIHHREPGLPAAIMNHSKVMVSIVPDNIHVNFEMVKLAKKMLGERLFIITDAVTETTSGPYPHTLEGNKYVSNGILSGSALTMMKAVKNCVTKCGIELGEALRMASYYPATVINKQHELGIIKAGIEANLVFMNEDLEVVK